MRGSRMAGSHAGERSPGMTMMTMNTEAGRHLVDLHCAESLTHHGRRPAEPTPATSGLMAAGSPGSAGSPDGALPTGRVTRRRARQWSPDLGTTLCPHWRRRDHAHCKAAKFADPAMAEGTRQWRSMYRKLAPAARRNLMLRYLRETGGPCHVSRRGRRLILLGPHRAVRWMFLGVPVCHRAFRRLSGTNPWRPLQDFRRGLWVYKHAGFHRTSVVEEQMHGAIWAVVRHFALSNPLAPGSSGHSQDPDEMLMPFHEKVYLFRVIQLWHMQQLQHQKQADLMSAESAGSAGSGRACKVWFSTPPKYRTFLKVLRRPEFAKVKFHRVVNMARCPRCCYLRWRCMSSPPEQREQWQRLAAAHQYLQLAQKRVYAADRAIASSDYPRSELYMAMDCGSGSEFVLPHLAAHDIELPSKAIASFHTLPMKVLNGLIHGDTRSHVVLSAGSAIAGANHTCEGLAILINTAFSDHWDLPRRATVQLDNASTNHNMLVLAFMALYVPRASE